MSFPIQLLKMRSRKIAILFMRSFTSRKQGRSWQVITRSYFIVYDDGFSISANEFLQDIIRIYIYIYIYISLFPYFSTASSLFLYTAIKYSNRRRVSRVYMYASRLDAYVCILSVSLSLSLFLSLSLSLSLFLFLTSHKYTRSFLDCVSFFTS